MEAQQFKLMAFSTSITVQEALVGINSVRFPPDLLSTGDLAWHPGGNPGTDVGHRFRWTGSDGTVRTGTEWVSDPADMPT